jgi:hypothetical protein
MEMGSLAPSIDRVFRSADIVLLALERRRLCRGRFRFCAHVLGPCRMRPREGRNALGILADGPAEARSTPPWNDQRAAAAIRSELGRESGALLR